MQRADAEGVLRGSHSNKKVYESVQHARNDARLLKRTVGEDCTAYRCPFSSITGGEHWHVGHPPPMGRVVDIAAAIRFFAQYGLTDDPA